MPERAKAFFLGAGARSEETPTVTVAIPLYRSLRFVDDIVANAQNLRWPIAEILISDRHCADDAIGILRDRLRGDPRVRFLSARDQLDWVTHCNLLLDASRSEYFIWMTHDDAYPGDYVPRLVEALENDPSAMLAFGVTIPELIDPSGTIPEARFLTPPIASASCWSPMTALRLAQGANLGLAFRGVFRRRKAGGLGLRLPRVFDTYNADELWIFALALHGPVLYVPDAVCTKRFYRDSAATRWSYTWRPRLSALLVRLRMILGARITVREKSALLLGLCIWKLGLN